MFVRALAMLFPLWMIGCAAAGALETKADGADNEDADGDADTASDDTDAAPFLAGWYALAGQLRVEGGSPTLANAELHFVLGGESEDGGIDRMDCEPLDLSALQTSTPPVVADYSLVAWWELEVPLETGCENAAGLPTTLGVGLGSLHPEVIAQLGTVGLEDEQDRLVGTWLTANGGEPFPFGYAEGAAGEELSDSLPDDLYAFQPLLILELAE